VQSKVPGLSETLPQIWPVLRLPNLSR